MRVLSDLIGIRGRDATASKGGYLYQDYATAIAWLKLQPNDLLCIEVAEDYAEENESSATLTQVKRVKRSLTLAVSLPFLEDVLEHIEKNASRQLSFVYLTSASVGQEQGYKFPGNQAGIDVWNDVKSGADPEPLLEVLRQLAVKGTRLHKFLGGNTSQGIVSKFVERVYWAVNAPDLEQLRSIALDAFCKRVAAENGESAARARELFPALIEHVIGVSVKAEREDRVLSHSDLNALIAKLFSATLLHGEINQLRRDAAIVASLDPRQFDAEIKKRTTILRQIRFFPETSPQDQAKTLLRDVRNGGALQTGSPLMRARAMAWCARVLTESAPDDAEQALQEADSICNVPDTLLARALKVASTDIGAAKALISDLMTPEAMFARYAIERKRSPESALEWLSASDLVPGDFDEDGQFFVLNDAMQLGRWDLVELWVDKIPEPSGESPALRWGLAFALVGLAATSDTREAVVTSVPVLGQVVLRDTALDFAKRLRSASEFRKFSNWASLNGAQSRSHNALKYGLWLELSDPDLRVAAAAEIEAQRVADTNGFQWIALALESGSSFDVNEHIERLDKRLTRYGSITFDNAEALVALLMSSEPEVWIQRLARFSMALSEYFTPEGIAEFGMKALLVSGRPAEARKWIEEASSLSEDTRSHLSNWIEGRLSGNEVGVLERRSGETSSILIRRQLINARARRKDYKEAVEDAKAIYQESRSHDDLETLIRLLMRCERWAEVVELLTNQSFVKAPQSVWSALRFALFNMGHWSSALQSAEDHMEESPELREFRKQVALYSGRWDRLGVLLEQALHDPNAEPEDLLQWAFIALVLDKPQVSKLLTRRALAVPGGDVGRHFQGYMLAVKGNWQSEPDVVQWLRFATENATEDGSVRIGNLRDLVDMAPAWQEKVERISRETAAGNLFQALVAKAVNQPLSGLYTAVAEHNRNQGDPGQYRPIPAFSASRDTKQCSDVSRIALDATALLTLADLDLLNSLVLAFDSIAVAHPTGAWLFKEREKTPHHQPSQVAYAKKRVSRFSRGSLQVLPSAREYSRALAAEVGDEIPRLIASAKTCGLESWLLIQIAPVHRPNSLGEIEADVSACMDKLRSLHCLVRSLHSQGIITDTSLEEAQRFLGTVDRGWPDEGLLVPKSTLILTELALTYLEHMGLVEACVKSEYSLWVDVRVRDEAHAYESIEDASQAVLLRLDRAREFLELTGQSGKVIALPRSKKRAIVQDGSSGSNGEQGESGVLDESEFEPTAVRVLTSLMDDLSTVDAIVIDDRAANRHPKLTDASDGQCQTMTSLDVLDSLRDRNAITVAEWLSARSLLRESGYIFIPFEREELLQGLRSSAVQDGILQESRYARIIRENHSLAQYSGLLQQPQEAQWLASNNTLLRQLVGELWSSDETAEVAAAKSDWLIELMRLDGFGSSRNGVIHQARWDAIDALRIWQLVLPMSLPESRGASYASWVESRYVSEMRAQRPAVYSILVENVKGQVAAIQEQVNASDYGVPEEQKAKIGAWMAAQNLDQLPASLRESIMGDSDLLKKLSFSRKHNVSLNIEGRPILDAALLHTLAGNVFDSKSDVEIPDSSGRVWRLKSTGTGEVWAHEQEGLRNFQVLHAAVFSKDQQIRQEYLRRLYESYGLDTALVSTHLCETPTVALLDAMEAEIEATPRAFVEKLCELLQKGAVRGEDLIPKDRKYYERLVPLGQHQSLKEFSEELGRDAISVDIGGLQHALLQSSHSSLVPVGAIVRAHPDELKRWMDEHLEGLDIWSLVGFVEGLLQRDDIQTEFSDECARTCQGLSDLLGPKSNRIALQAALVSFIDGWLNTSNLLTNAQPSLRRMVGIAHAALIERVLIRAEVTLQGFIQWAEQGWARFQAASLCDLPAEPRWHGYLLQPSQLSQELIGRVMNIANVRREVLEGTTWGHSIFGEGEQSLASSWSLAYAALPGPLEGASESAIALNQTLIDESHAILADSEQPILERLMIVAHTTGFGQAPAELLDGVVSLLRQIDATVLDISESQMQRLVMTLAMAAADSRHTHLASALQDFLIHRPHLPIELRIHAGITACGAYSVEDEWVLQVTSLVRRTISYGLNREDSTHVLFVLKAMCDAQSALRAPLASSMARLEASSKRG